MTSDTTTEQHRHRCEVRDLLAQRSRKGATGRLWLAEYLRQIEAKRGQEAADLLRSDIAQQWERGNRGGPGQWFEGVAA